MKNKIIVAVIAAVMCLPAMAQSIKVNAYAALDLLNSLKTVDGSGSGLDADFLRGISSAGYARLALTGAWSGTLTITGADLLGVQTTAGTITAWRMSSGLGATVPTKPACAVDSDAGRMVYLNDTDDSVTADACVCGVWTNGSSAMSWVSMVYYSAGAPVACAL